MITRRAMMAAAFAPRARRYGLAKVEADEMEPPPGQRLPFGWRAVPLRGEVKLSFATPGTRLRITNALDSREPRTVDVLAPDGARLGAFDLRYAYAGQPFELPLPSPLQRLSLRPGMGEGTTWIFTSGAPEALLPHFLMKEGCDPPNQEFERRLRGMEAAQPFGWLQGCVLDALRDLGWRKELHAHLRLHLPDDERLIYEDPRSRPSDNEFRSIEETLPVALMAFERPRHKAIDLAIDYWMKGRDAEGCVVGGGSTTCEGSYTVAYPMAAVARLRRNGDLEALAIRQLRLRRDRLATADAIVLRRLPDGRTTYRNWARGVAWYMLGLARTLELLRDRKDLDDLRDELRRTVGWVLTLQRSDGLWNCYLDNTATLAETSGSAGIAAAVARAARLGLAGEHQKDAARRTLGALEDRLTPDGFLTGVSQSNRAGEELQRSGYRVISQMGMGLMGQLMAALR